MLKQFSILIPGILMLSACAHHQAVRVDCEGPLHAINRPAPGATAVPASSTSTSTSASPLASRPGKAPHER